MWKHLFGFIQKQYLFCSALYFLIKGSLCVCVLYVKSDGFVLFEMGRNWEKVEHVIVKLSGKSFESYDAVAGWRGREGDFVLYSELID